jgi:hypothetical protein
MSDAIIFRHMSLETKLFDRFCRAERLVTIDGDAGRGRKYCRKKQKRAERLRDGTSTLSG